MSETAILAEWRAHLEHGRRRSPHTVRAYVATAARLMEALPLPGWTAIAELDGKALRTQLAARRAEGIGNASAARELSALKAFIAFARQRAGWAETAPPRLRGPRLKKGLPRPVTPDDIEALASEVQNQGGDGWTGRRDAAVLLLLYGAGLRIAEALSLDGGAVPLGETLRVTGKGDKERIVPVLPIVRDAVAAYVAVTPYPPQPGKPLFRGKRGGALNQGAVQQAVARARTVLGLPPTATPHALRHSFASHLLGAGADLRSLQELLGHASLGSTQIYTKVDAARMLESYRAAHPRERG